MFNKILKVLTPAFFLIGGLLALYAVAIQFGLETVSFAFLLGFPVIAGCVIMRFRPKGSFQTLGKGTAWLVGIMLLSILGAYLTGQEGLVCIAMAIVPILIGTMAGGFAYLITQRWRDERGSTLKTVTLPICVLLALSAVSTEPRTYIISHDVLIDAPTEHVFGMLKSIPNIAASEVPTTASHLLGVPKPTAAVWENGLDGDVRHSYWGADVHFREVITDVVQDRRIAWNFAFPEGWAAEGIEDPHVKVGGHYFDVISGNYQLEDINGKTRLTLSTRTYDHSGLGAYAKFWHEFFFKDFHHAILHVVKTRAEMQVSG